MDVADETYIVRFKSPQMGVQLVAASSAEIHGDHIALLNSDRQLVALLLLDIVESLSVVERPGPNRIERCRITSSAKSSEKTT